MSPLSDGLPEEARKKFILGKLLPGCVVRLEVKFPDKSKPKFLVLVAEDDPEYWTFVINTEIHSFVHARPHLLQCQVKVNAAENPFLQYDSHLACHEILKLRREEVVQALMHDSSGLKGQISEAVRDQIIAAVKFAQTLSPNEKQQILNSLAP